VYENVKGRCHLKDLGEDERKGLKQMLNRVRGCGMDSCGSG
jgi:hypothetical protein